MLQSPDYEPEFYEKQVIQMKDRFAKIFKGFKLPWKTYIKDVEKRLRGRTYWLWNYLIGLESFIQPYQKSGISPNKEYLEKDKDSRISRIVGDFYKVEQYVKGL